MKNITKVFKELRKLGYFAQQDFWCCNTCAWGAIPENEDKIVFYHAQSGQDLKETGSCYLNWKGNAEEIRKVFENNGIKTEHNGSKDNKILIILE